MIIPYKRASFQSIFWQITNTSLKEVLFVLLGVFLLSLSAHISIPLRPVPLTFQSATVILIGMLSGTRLGAYTILAYLAAGFSGLPVFAGHLALGAFWGPSIGYLIGFLPAVALSGYLAERGWAQSVLKSFVATCLSAAVIFLFGISILTTFVGLKKAVLLGLMPFVFTEPLKLLAISFLIPQFWKKCDTSTR